MPGAYLELARRPHVPALLSLGILARLPVGMVPLAVLLSARGHGHDYGVAGLVVGAYTVGLALGAPFAGRRLDRLGPVRVLTLRAVAYPTLLAGVAVLLVADVTPVLVGIAAFGAGASLPPVGPAVRALWGAVVEGRLLQTAFALEAALQELYFTIGPLLVAGLAVVDPVLALGVGAGTTLVGTLLLARLPPLREVAARPRDDRRGSFAGALVSPGVRTVVLYAGCCGVGFGAMEVALPAFAERHGSASLAGVVLACFATGSLVGGLVAGARHAADQARRLRLAALCLAPAFAVTLLAPSIAVMCACILVAGLPIAPGFAASYAILDRVASPGTLSEAFAWNSTAIVAGASVGTAVAGQLVDASGPDAAILLATAAAASAACMVLMRPRSLAAPLAQPAASR